MLVPSVESLIFQTELGKGLRTMQLIRLMMLFVAVSVFALNSGCNSETTTAPDTGSQTEEDHGHDHGDDHDHADDHDHDGDDHDHDEAGGESEEKAPEGS